jgi:Gas vesicle synthesis protein GvpL/GvpF
MSEVHVYGVVPASAKPEITEEGVRLISHRDVVAIVSDIDPADLRAVSVLRAHWRVLEQAGTNTTVLPVRFGTVMLDDHAVVTEFLEPSHDDLAARLADMAGKVQLSVKGTYEEEALMASVVARSPVVARLRREVTGLPEAATYYKRIELGRLVGAEIERVREHDARAIMERLEQHALAARLEPQSAPESAVSAAFLVDEARIDEFSNAVSALGRELEGRIRLRYVGPLPPYSFTGEDAGARAWA